MKVKVIAVVVLFLLFIVSKNLALGILPYIFLFSAIMIVVWPFLKSKSGRGGDSNSQSKDDRSK